MASRNGVPTPALKRLLVLARDLLQVPDLRSVLELVGPALHEVLGPDGALLIVAFGGQECVTEFGRSGIVHARLDTALYRHARQTLADCMPLLLPELAADPAARGLPTPATASLLAFPFPPVHAVGVLAVLWNRKGHRHQLASQIPTVRCLAEITGAAIGNVAYRKNLEDRVRAGTEEMARASLEHASELRRRDSLQEEIHRISVTDVMTGMLNRRGFFLNGEQSLKLARRQGSASALIYADIDGLKAVNDHLGHEAGDRLIQDAARAFQDSFRSSDVVARLGGDEFAALTLDAAEPEAILARIRENIDRLGRRPGATYRFSFSTGIVRCDPAAELALSDYLALADQQMYARKKERSPPGPAE